MSLRSIVSERYGRWKDALYRFGYLTEEHPAVTTSARAGTHLEASSWHAQLGPGEQGAERMDVDRRKPADLILHRHPFGSPNDEREPERDMDAPEAWITHVEGLSANLYFQQTKPTK